LQPCAETGRFYPSVGGVVPHGDDLADVAAGRGVHVETEVIAGAVVRQRNPFGIPPIVPNSHLGFTGDSVEVAAVEQVFPDLPLLPYALQTEKLAAICESGSIARLSVVDSVGFPDTGWESDTEVSLRLL